MPSSPWLTGFAEHTAIHPLLEAGPKRVAEVGEQLRRRFELPDDYFTPLNSLELAAYADRLASPSGSRKESQLRHDLALLLLGDSSPVLREGLRRHEMDAGLTLYHDRQRGEAVLDDLTEDVLSAKVLDLVRHRMSSLPGPATSARELLDVKVLRVDRSAPQGSLLAENMQRLTAVVGKAMTHSNGAVVTVRGRPTMLYDLSGGQALLGGDPTQLATLDHESWHLGEPNFGAAIREARASFYGGTTSYKDVIYTLFGVQALTSTDILGDVRSVEPGGEVPVMYEWMGRLGVRSTFELHVLQPADVAYHGGLAARVNSGLRHDRLTAGDSIQFRLARRELASGRGEVLASRSRKYAASVLEACDGDLAMLARYAASDRFHTYFTAPAGARVFDMSFFDALVTEILLRDGHGKGYLRSRNGGPEVAKLRHQLGLSVDHSHRGRTASRPGVSAHR